jgi:hypothetical protein
MGSRGACSRHGGRADDVGLALASAEEDRRVSAASTAPPGPYYTAGDRALPAAPRPVRPRPAPGAPPPDGHAAVRAARPGPRPATSPICCPRPSVRPRIPPPRCHGPHRPQPQNLLRHRRQMPRVPHQTRTSSSTTQNHMRFGSKDTRGITRVRSLPTGRQFRRLFGPPGGAGSGVEAAGHLLEGRGAVLRSPGAVRRSRGRVRGGSDRCRRLRR